jgi:hypothetical protein
MVERGTVTVFMAIEDDPNRTLLDFYKGGGFNNSQNILKRIQRFVDCQRFSAEPFHFNLTELWRRAV